MWAQCKSAYSCKRRFCGIKSIESSSNPALKREWSKGCRTTELQVKYWSKRFKWGTESTDVDVALEGQPKLLFWNLTETHELLCRSGVWSRLIFLVSAMCDIICFWPSPTIAWEYQIQYSSAYENIASPTGSSILRRILDFMKRLQKYFSPELVQSTKLRFIFWMLKKTHYMQWKHHGPAISKKYHGHGVSGFVDCTKHWKCLFYYASRSTR
jgi:hypothetical protein